MDAIAAVKIRLLQILGLLILALILAFFLYLNRLTTQLVIQRNATDYLVYTPDCQLIKRYPRAHLDSLTAFQWNTWRSAQTFFDQLHWRSPRCTALRLSGRL